MTPDTIILHCSDTEDGPGLSWPAIRRYHTSFRCHGTIIIPEAADNMARAGMPVERPWSDIGYHFGIERFGGQCEYEILMGRMSDVQGAHCAVRGMNRHSLGVCFVGRFDHAPMPADQWQAGLKLVRALMRIYGLSVKRVFGHREIDGRKTCPGMHFDLDRFRRELF